MALRKIISAKTNKATWQIDYLEPDGKRVRKNYKTKKEADVPGSGMVWLRSVSSAKASIGRSFCTYL